MEALAHYTLKLNSMALLPKYDEYGNLGTIVVEQNESYYVNKRNYDVMERSLQYFGTTMRAVKEGMKDFIGTMNMPPVALQALQLTVWMPTKAVKDELCAWLNILFIVDCKAINKQLCKIIFIDGTTVEIDLPREKLLRRLKQAYAIFAILYIRSLQMQWKNHYAAPARSYILNEKQRGYDEGNKPLN